jgi:hypothetical protein
VGIVIGALICWQYFAWRWRQNVVDLYGTVLTGNEIQIVVNEFQRQFGHYPTRDELLQVLPYVFPFEMGLSPAVTNRIVPNFDNLGGWCYDQTSGEIKANYDGRYFVGLQTWIDPSKINFYPPTKVQANQSSGYKILDYSRNTNWLNANQPQVEEFIKNWAATNTLEPHIGKQVLTLDRAISSNTVAGLELKKMLAGKDEDIDLALANWLMATDIPEFHDMTRQSWFTQLGNMTEQVRTEMQRMQVNGYGGTDPNDPKARCQRFCSAIIGLHFSYAEQFREENLTAAQSQALYSNPDNVFLAGLLRTGQGSCVSMPLIYLVIGQKLGLPVHLVALGKHFFIRWDEPGFRMDIETTSVSKIAWTPNDSTYLDIEGMKRDQLCGSDLRNLTNREVVGELLFTRMSYWHAKGDKYEAQSQYDLVQAHELAPDDPVIEKTYEAVINHKPSASQYASADNHPEK